VKTVLEKHKHAAHHKLSSFWGVPTLKILIDLELHYIEVFLKKICDK